MKPLQKMGIRSLLVGAALAASVVFTGCAGHVAVGYRSYDPYYTDYHVWGQPEIVFYSQWEGDTHRSHREFRRRTKSEQHDYWNWRHSHGGAGQHRDSR